MTGKKMNLINSNDNKDKKSVELKYNKEGILGYHSGLAKEMWS